MPLETESPVRSAEHLSRDLGERMPDWHALWVFIELERSGSFRAASTRLNMSVNAIRRRIDDLERIFGVKLLTRHVEGITLTEEGRSIQEGALRMEREAFAILRSREALTDEDEGVVRIAVTEGLGSAWVMPRLVEFQQIFPKLRVDLICGMTSSDVLRMEADFAVQLTQPDAPDLKFVRLGWLHVMPFASRKYAATHNLPKSREELAGHKFVLQVADQTKTLSIFADLFQAIQKPRQVAITTNLSSTHALAIANGAGIGWLPTYVHALKTDLVPIDCDCELVFDVWLTYHPDVQKIPRVRFAIDWIRASFDNERFPFFGEQFIHPTKIDFIDKYVSLSEFYKGFIR